TTEQTAMGMGQRTGEPSQAEAWDATVRRSRNGDVRRGRMHGTRFSDGGRPIRRRPRPSELEARTSSACDPEMVAEADEPPTRVDRRVEDLVHLVRGRAPRADDEEVVPECELELTVLEAGRELIARDADAVVGPAGVVFTHQADGLEVVRPHEASVVDRERQKHVEAPVQRHRLIRARDEYLE